MKHQYYYLAINIACLLVPLILSFNFKGQFYKKWYAALPSIIVTAIFFILWDEPFTQWGVWGFNPKYILGIYIMNLPLEEILFFICIPYACLFTYDQLKERLPNLTGRWGINMQLAVAFVLTAVFIGCGDQKYTTVITFSSVIFMALTYFIDRHYNKSREYLNHFYLAYLIVLIPFFVSNGLLTGYFTPEPIVWYNAEEHLGITAGTIPINDFAYYFLLFFMNTWLYERLLKVK